MTDSRRRLYVGITRWVGAGLAALSAYMLTLESFAAWDWFKVSIGVIAHVAGGVTALGAFFNPVKSSAELGIQGGDKSALVSRQNSGFVFGAASEEHLLEGDADIVEVHRLALQLSPIDFAIIDANREYEEQRENIAKGVSWTMDSGHLQRPSKAIDHLPWVDGKEDWSWEAFKQTTDAIKQASKILGVPCTHGIDWKGKKRDGAHTELDRSVYTYDNMDIELT